MPLDLVPVFPVFQMEFGKTANLQYVGTSKFGLPKLSLLLADCAHGSKVSHTALLKVKPSSVHVDQLICGISSLKVVTELDILIIIGGFHLIQFTSINS